MHFSNLHTSAIALRAEKWFFNSFKVWLCCYYPPYGTEHESRLTWHNIHADSCRMSPHGMALQRFVLLQENCAIEFLLWQANKSERLRVMRPIMGAFPRLSVLPFFWYSSTLNNNLHRNQCNNFHIPNSLDFLWNSYSRKIFSHKK